MLLSYFVRNGEMNMFNQSYCNSMKKSDDLVQDSNISSALAMEILQSCPKPLILFPHYAVRG